MDEAKDQINDIEHKEEKTFNKNNKKKKNSKRNKGRPRSPWENLKCTNIQIIGVTEGEEKEQGIENLFEKTVKENSPNLVKEIDIQVQEAQSPKQDGHKENHTKAHHNYNAKS